MKGWAMATLSIARPDVTRSSGGPSRGHVLSLVTSLYITQYLGVGFIYVGLTAMLRREGVSLQSLAAVSLAGIFWALKPLWAPLLDHFGRTRHGHYRTWLLVADRKSVV